jgi:leucyl aminopeptidase
VAKIHLTDSTVIDEILVVGLSRREDKTLAIESGEITLNTNSLLAALADVGATGESDEVIKFPGTKTRLIVFTGLGKYRRNYPHEILRRAAGAATRALAGNESITLSLPTNDLSSLAAVAEGATLGAYSFNDFRGSTKGDQREPVIAVTIHTAFAGKAKARNIASRAQIIGKYTAMVRDLVNMPASHLSPDSFVKLVSQATQAIGGSGAGLNISSWDKKQLKTQGFGGIISVGQGSANSPRLLHISYSPPKARKRVALVGKGITFDSGGLNLKPGLGMEAMKSDMSGAAAVCALTLAIAALKLPIAIDAWAPLAENMVSDTATRPGDIITIYGGKTVEVLNPDAEGRLVLADALVKAIEVGSQGQPLYGIVDVATLTGSQVVALGTRTSAVMTNNEIFRAKFLEAASLSGENFWPMPLPEELLASLDSPVADLANIGEKMGGMLVAGLFLREFIPKELPWLHLDIAGPAYNDGAAHGYTPVGGTGIALRSLLQLVESLVM